MKQNGAATLLMALVLMMSATVITLAVARSQLIEQRITANGNWHTRLQLAAGDGLAQGRANLDNNFDSLVWQSLPSAGSVSPAPVSGSNSTDIDRQVTYRRSAAPGKFIVIESTAQRNDRSGMAVRISQYVRPLSVLTPATENGPPLVLAGCLLSTAISFHIRPVNADSGQAGEVAWMDSSTTCPFPANIDIHGGSIRRSTPDADLWYSIFSVSRQQLVDLATADQARPANQRRYWAVDASGVPAGQWSRSLGTAQQPVVLYFPASIPCPEFSPGVQIHGLVFIDNDCSQSVGSTSLEIYGTLVVNGNLDVRQVDLQLNHIQVADNQLTGLEFPPLRSVPVPGTWKDF